MLQALLRAKKQRFGRSCEASQISGQMSLFETTEELIQVLEKEEEKISVPTYTRKPRKPGVRKEMLACIPKEVEEYIINEEDTCSKCGSSLKVIGKEIPGSKGDEARGYIDSLFHIEKKIKELSYEEKKDKRQVASRAALDAFWSWCEETKNIPTTNEKLTKALNYAMNHRVQLEAFLLDGRLEISNNLCESHIRPFATGRKSWLFADTPQGATASAVAYTLAESAKANGLNVYEYFRHILTQMPNVDFYNHPEEIEKLLPWSDELPEICRLAQKYKKHLEK